MTFLLPFTLCLPAITSCKGMSSSLLFKFFQLSKFCSVVSITVISCVPCYFPLTTSYFAFNSLMHIHSGLFCKSWWILFSLCVCLCLCVCAYTHAHGLTKTRGECWHSAMLFLFFWGRDSRCMWI